MIVRVTAITEQIRYASAETGNAYGPTPPILGRTKMVRVEFAQPDREPGFCLIERPADGFAPTVQVGDEYELEWSFITPNAQS